MKRKIKPIHIMMGIGCAVLMGIMGGIGCEGPTRAESTSPGSPGSPGRQAPKDPRLGGQVYIAAGNYYIGSDVENDNRPLRQVYFPGFYIDIHPVTEGQYLEFLSKSDYRPGGKFDMESARENPDLPAANLTFEDAAAYAAFNRKRLPTEWEWEIAARALKKETVYVSQTLPPNLRGHFFSSKKYRKTPVFSYPPNELGLYDLAGNVYEWTGSEYEKKYLRGKYFQDYRIMVLRGGSWTNRPFDIRAASRIPFPAGRSLDWIGFRCVADGSGMKDEGDGALRADFKRLRRKN